MTDEQVLFPNLKHLLEKLILFQNNIWNPVRLSFPKAHFPSQIYGIPEEIIHLFDANMKHFFRTPVLNGGWGRNNYISKYFTHAFVINLQSFQKTLLNLTNQNRYSQLLLALQNIPQKNCFSLSKFLFWDRTLPRWIKVALVDVVEFKVCIAMQIFSLWRTGWNIPAARGYAATSTVCIRLAAAGEAQNQPLLSAF